MGAWEAAHANSNRGAAVDRAAESQHMLSHVRVHAVHSHHYTDSAADVSVSHLSHSTPHASCELLRSEHYPIF